jgi:hypothetical protein
MARLSTPITPKRVSVSGAARKPTERATVVPTAQMFVRAAKRANANSCDHWHEPARAAGSGLSGVRV